MIYTKPLDAPLPQAGDAVLVNVEARRADSNIKSSSQIYLNRSRFQTQLLQGG